MAQQFGRFWLHEKLGHGGMAEIFRATVGPEAGTFEVAVKRLHPHLIADEAQVSMFLTEADVTKFLDHPNLLRVYEAGFVGEQPYIVMDYVWGIDLGRLMDLLRARRGRFPVDLAVYVTMQVLRGLDYVHRAKAPGGEPMDMIHRDITPDNVFCTFGGEVKIGDFGVARVSFLEPREEARILKGKPAYIPPEVLAGEPVGQSDDIWAVALVLYEMLTGRPVGQEIDPDDLISGRQRLRIPPIRRLNPDVDSMLAEILARALSPQPRRRPPDAYTLYGQLKLLMHRQGIQVTGEALAQFVRGATGVSSAVVAPITEPTAGFFATSDYRAPAGPSMTQRMELVRRQRRWLGPVMATAAAVVVGVGALIWWLATGG